MIDDIDRKILTILIRNAALTKAEVARMVGIAASAVSERIKRLVESGVIGRYELHLSPALLGYPVLAYIFIAESKPTTASTAERLAAVSGVEEVHKIAGEDCYLVKLRARSNEELATILDCEINQIESVRSVRTTIVLKTVLEDVVLGGAEEFAIE